MKKRSATVTINTVTSYRTLEAPIHLPAHESRQNMLRSTMITLLSGLITDFGYAVQVILEYFRANLAVTFTEGSAEAKDKRMIHARLTLVISGKDIQRAKNLLAQPMTEFGYTNAYRLISLEEIPGSAGDSANTPASARVIFEIAQTATIDMRRGGQKRVLKSMPANFLGQVILSWGKFSVLAHLGPSEQTGIAQKVAEQILSYLELVDTDARTAFPSISERRPLVRQAQWGGVLERILRNEDGFEYVRARDIDPTIPEDDKRGDRRINVDPDWIEFVKSPVVGRFPDVFAKNDVVVYQRSCDNHTGDEKRLYALIPVSDEVIQGNLRLLWWQKHKEEFTPLPAFGERSWPKARRPAIMVPLQHGAKSRRTKLRVDPEYQDSLTRLLSEPGRSVRWTILSEKHNSAFGHGGHGLKRRMKNRQIHDSRWVLQFVTATEVMPIKHADVLGIHFQDKPVLSWALVRDGQVIEEGSVEANTILDDALDRKGSLESQQRKHRWVGNRRFSPETKRRTVELARKIAELAARMKARIVLEDIVHVGKSGPNGALNSRFSLWNYSELPTKIAQIALDRHGIAVTVQNEYVAKFGCPSCDACRGKGETEENAATWRNKVEEGGAIHHHVLDCRKCGAKTLQDHTYMAKRIALLGWKSA